MNHPHDPNLSFDTKYQPPQKSDGEWQYSLGNPPLPERHSISSVFWKGVDVTELIHQHMPDMFETWEEDINA